MIVKADPYKNPKSLSFRFRKRRFKLVKRLIDGVLAEKGTCRIIDIGGTQKYWDISDGYIDNDNIQIHLINKTKVSSSKSNFSSVIGDATELGFLDDRSFDLVHSNSVIEHVGTWNDMRKMAFHVQRLAPIYYVQTPNFWFPYEPHLRFPIYHWMPEQIRFRLLMNLNLGWGGKRKDVDSAMQAVQSWSLLDKRQFSDLFPDAKIINEKFLVLTKSLIAIRSNGS